MTHAVRERSGAWKWWVCGLLLCASAINYMDRQTLANASVRITRELHLSQQQYGGLELAFGWSFAAGSLLFGWLADKVAVRWLYPLVLLLWSLAGFATGLAENYEGLLICRGLLGFFEAGHWPCAIKTTQRLLASKDRTMGNGLLQSGTSVGAIITPLIMSAMLTPAPGSWRFPFQAIAVVGILWIGLWFWLVRPGELGVTPAPANAPAGGLGDFFHLLFSRRMLILLLTITLINTTWQLLRAWLTKFLIEGRGYPEADALYFNTAFFIASDIGCFGAGVATLWLHRRKFSEHNSRMLVFLGCSILTALSCVAAILPRGPALVFVLLLVAVGALGLFPVYHAFTQELSPVHQGKVTGAAGVIAWAIGSPLQPLFGRWVDQTGSFDRGIAIAGWFPLLAFAAIWLLWDKDGHRDATPNAATSRNV
jgi:ACS family hexuronate transporter-like MFS transporter